MITYLFLRNLKAKRVIFFCASKENYFMDAAKAREYANSAQKKTNSEEINVKLTFERLLGLIEKAAKNGSDFIEFSTPRFVLDGSLIDPVLMAKRLRRLLEEKDFTVKRKQEILTIYW